MEEIDEFPWDFPWIIHGIFHFGGLLAPFFFLLFQPNKTHRISIRTSILIPKDPKATRILIPKDPTCGEWITQDFHGESFASMISALSHEPTMQMFLRLLGYHPFWWLIATLLHHPLKQVQPIFYLQCVPAFIVYSFQPHPKITSNHQINSFDWNPPNIGLFLTSHLTWKSLNFSGPPAGGSGSRRWVSSDGEWSG